MLPVLLLGAVAPSCWREIAAPAVCAVVAELSLSKAAALWLQQLADAAVVAVVAAVAAPAVVAINPLLSV